MITRRQFLKYSAATGAALTLPLKLGVRSANAYAMSPGLRKFIDTMPLFITNITLAQQVLGVYDPTTVDYYDITGGVFRQSVSSDMQRAMRVNNPGFNYNGTRLYGYKDTAAGSHQALGAPILATGGKPVRLRVRNNLPTTHIIPFDLTITQGPNVTATQKRMAVHLHGGLVPWTSDGGPFHWFEKGFDTSGAGFVAGSPNYGASWQNWLPDNNNVLTNDIYYPNHQSARFMWYHDHAIGITRTSAYAGLATGYIIIDPADPEDVAVMTSYGPGLIMAFQDKVFWDPANDPNFSLYVNNNAADAGGVQAGDLWYPYMYEKAIWKLQGNAKAAPLPSAIPEMFGDTMLVNGTCFPTHNVPGTTVRIRTLNACNARFLNLKFVYEDSATPGEPLGGYLAPVAAPVNVWIIGTEGGYLPAAKQVVFNGTPVSLTALLNGPAERLDLIVDFSGCAGSNLLLYNDAPAPYPIGAPIFDWYPLAPGNPGAAAILAGYGPNTRTIMKFVVGAYSPPSPIPALSGQSNPTLPVVTDAVNGGLMLNTAGPGWNGGTQWTNPRTSEVFNFTPPPPTPAAAGAHQNLTLNETFDVFGRLMQLVGTTVPLVKGTFGRGYLDPPTEMVTYGTIQIWNIYNLTADTHPMHVHLFNAMILRRRPFKVQGFNGIPVWRGPGRGPDPGEEGWKETFKMWPGECTTIAVLVEPPLPGNVRTVDVTNAAMTVHTGTLPTSPRLAALGVNGDEYVWHCHILEHEEHDMMRPLVGT